MKLKLAHTADVHLDAKATIGGSIVRNEQGANVRWLDRLRCFGEFEKSAIAHGCNMAVIAGDLFETSRPTPQEYTNANLILDGLASKMPVILIADNHGNPESAQERHAVEPIGGRHNNLYVFHRPGVVVIETGGFFGEGLNIIQRVVVAALPSPRRSVLMAKDEYQGMMPEEINLAISHKLKSLVSGLLAKAKETPDAIRVLVGHVMLRGADIGDDLATRTAIALDPEDLVGWDYVALGDVHRAQSFLGGRVRYSGSLDRTDFGEEHDPKSWSLVTLDKTGEAPAEFTVEEIPSPARRFITLTPDELFDQSGQESGQIVRVKGTISQEKYQELVPILNLWRQVPTFCEQLDIEKLTRSRNVNITDEMNAESALRQWAQDNGHTEIAESLVAEHNRLAASLT